LGAALRCNPDPLAKRGGARSKGARREGGSPGLHKRAQRARKVGDTHRPEFPHNGFADLDEARAWAAHFVRWYNHEHRHSAIRCVSPAQRHAGDDTAILAARHELYQQARERNPRRESGATRNWTPIAVVTPNPERNSVVKTHAAGIDRRPLAA
jgi:hypothetical protein